MKVTILGCGSSAGVPLIGCRCEVCQSDNQKNERSRVSILIEEDDSKLLVDASPDLRQQALTNDFKTIDGLFITHAHADHCHGIDEIRSFNFHRNDLIPLYADEDTMQALERSFGYIFQPPSPYGWIRAAVAPNYVEHAQSIQTGAITWTPFKQDHGSTMSYGMRSGNFAYSTDVKSFPEESTPYLQNLDVWVVDCLRYDEAPTHAHLDLALQWIDKYQPKRAILTHMSHVFDYDKLLPALPANVEPAYDGMQIHL